MMDYKKQLDRVIRRIDENMEKIKTAHLRGSDKDGIYTNSERSFFAGDQWTFSFHTGMVFFAYMHTGDLKYLKYLNTFKETYEDKVYRYADTTMHDLGFLYSLYSVAEYKLTGDLRAKETALKAADELGKRFNIN